MDQNVIAQNAIADIQKALSDAKARSEKINHGLTELSRAMDRCRAMIAEHTACEQKIATLRADRRAMLADSVMSKGDATALARNDRDLKAAEARLKDLAATAEDGKAAIAELEARYAEAQKPLLAMGKEIPRLSVVLLEEVAQTLLLEYGQNICDAYDVYCEIVALVHARNLHARAAGITSMTPENPQGLEYPGVALGSWKLRNSIFGATPAEFDRARARLAKKLADLGIPE